MAKASAPKTEDPEINLSSAKVKRLVIKNFRCIGQEPVSIDLDDIVVLVGPNNAGKSTILRAYEVVMLHGSTEGKLKIEDYPGEAFDAANVPEIELQTYVFDDLPGEQWIHIEEGTSRKYIRERWRWEEVGKDPKRQGRRAASEDWDDKVPWGAPNIAKSRRPIPHRVDAFASPEAQGEKIVSLLRDILLERAKRASDTETSALENLTTQIRAIQKQIVEQSKTEIGNIEQALSSYIKEIFVGFKVSLDTKTEEVSEKSFNIFSTTPILRMGPDDGHMAPLDKQGSGARRTLLWSALKIASDRQGDPVKKSTKAKAVVAAPGTVSDGEPEVITSRPHVLLLDEPEICLHPNAIRDACRVLYDLAAQDSGWQVMVTTHSPAFIDISRDNTTIVRVERTDQGAIKGTTVFRPARVSLSTDDKTTLKFLNQWDPYVGEFFFGGQTVLVEGDTEYSAFREIVEGDRKKYRNVHIVRARGKYIIPILIKIMNHFGSPYAVLHDTDVPKAANGNANPAWTANERILEAVSASPVAGRVRLVASIVDFEQAIFEEAATKDKPYNTVKRIREDNAARNKVASLLDYLIFQSDIPPTGIIAWSAIENLEKAVAPFISEEAST